ncbi:hypothetical protein GmHk_03G007360 [Glycine max]|nr:hypothetical protein GmHk_03G007360 [Glycine max]
MRCYTTHHPFPLDLSPSQLLDLLYRQPNCSFTQPNYSTHPSVFHELLCQLSHTSSHLLPLILLETYATSHHLHTKINPFFLLMECDFAVKFDMRFNNVALNLLIEAN